VKRPTHTRPLLVGESNPYGADPRFALYPLPEGASGHRLRIILGLGHREYLAAFDRANLTTGPWTLASAREAAARLLAERRTDAPLVLLGRRVALAFGAADFPSFTTCGRLYLLPHPSGRCLAWSEPGAAQQARDLLAPILDALAREGSHG